MDKTLRNSIVASILLISFSVAFYFIYFLPTKQSRLETARKDCSIITTISMQEALSRDGRENEKKIWEDNKCNRTMLDGSTPSECSRIKAEITKKELDNKMGKRVDAPVDEFDRCMRRKGFTN